jgi:hypothetical protein
MKEKIVTLIKERSCIKYAKKSVALRVDSNKVGYEGDALMAVIRDSRMFAWTMAYERKMRGRSWHKSARFRVSEKARDNERQKCRQGGAIIGLAVTQYQRQ